MKKIALTTLACVTVASAAAAQPDYSEMLRDQGIAATEAHLASLQNPSPSDQFALGGARFLLAVEHALQARYNTAIDPMMAEASGLPFLRLPTTLQNSTPDAFQSNMVEQLFQTALADLANVLPPLDAIEGSDTVSVRINTADLWFDVNANGNKDDGESFFQIVAPQLNTQLETEFTAPIVRFDTADAAWLSAYAHLLSGVSETILALDPTGAIDRVTQSAADMRTLGGGQAQGYFTPDDGKLVDLFAMFIHGIEVQPDVSRTRAAHTHFLDMIADNQTFWARVDAETDNKMEWIPNATQDSALPLPFPAETGEMWKAVLADAHDILTGEQLIPHWRLGSSAGINLSKVMQDPQEIDIISMIQGEGILPYAQKGKLAGGENLQRFGRMLQGDALLYMVILN